jgi:hypothetical protein
MRKIIYFFDIFLHFSKRASPIKSLFFFVVMLILGIVLFVKALQIFIPFTYIAF